MSFGWSPPSTLTEPGGAYCWYNALSRHARRVESQIDGEGTSNTLRIKRDFFSVD
jgi:hypothetical protein